MKVWRFYISKEKLTRGILEVMGGSGQLHNEGNYALYAVTNNPEFAEEFMTQRNKDFFFLKKSNMDKEDYADMVNEFHYLELNRYALQTKDVNDSGVIVPKAHEIVLTEYEHLSAGYNGEEGMWISVYSEDFWAGCPPLSMISNKTIVKALKFMEYDKFYKLMNAHDVFIGEDGEILRANGEDYDAPEVITDELSLFLKLFEDTFI